MPRMERQNSHAFERHSADHIQEPRNAATVFANADFTLQRQAAANAYAWFRANSIPEVDSFILHRHVDHAHEGGLKLGLWRRNEASSSASEPSTQKQNYDIFQHADQADWRQAFDFALPIIGVQRWDDVLAAKNP